MPKNSFPAGLLPRLAAGSMALTVFGLMACLDERDAPPLPITSAMAYSSQPVQTGAGPVPAAAALPAASSSRIAPPSLVAASAIAARSRLVPLLAGPAPELTGMGDKELSSAKLLLEELAERRIDRPAEDDALGQAFLEALRVAYRVSDVSELQGRVTAALVTDTRLGSDTRYYYFGETQKMFPSASTIKTAIAARFLADLEQQSDTDDFTVDGRDYSASLDNMFGWSDNHSANVLQDRYGVDGMNRWLRSIGIDGSDIKFRSPWVSKGPVPGGGNSCSAEGLAQLYFLLAQDGDVPDFLTNSSMVKLRGLLDSRGSVNTDPGHNDRLNALFPSSVHFLHKTGSNRRMLGDAGIVVDGERSYVLVILDRTVTRKAIQRFGLATLLMMREYDRDGWQDGDSPGLRYYTVPQSGGPQVLYASL